MKKADYNKLKKIFNGLKVANTESAKLPVVLRTVVDFAVIQATRETLKRWDNESIRHENFFEMLTAEIADAEYRAAEIVAKQEGITS